MTHFYWVVWNDAQASGDMNMMKLVRGRCVMSLLSQVLWKRAGLEAGWQVYHAACPRGPLSSVDAAPPCSSSIIYLMLFTDLLQRVKYSSGHTEAAAGRKHSRASYSHQRPSGNVFCPQGGHVGHYLNIHWDSERQSGRMSQRCFDGISPPLKRNVWTELNSNE